MKPLQLLKTYGSQNRIAKELGVSRQAVHRWFADNKIPQLRVYQIMILMQESKRARPRSV